MFGFIAKLTAKPGTREQLIFALSQNSSSMPGCLSYIAAKDSKDDNSIWVTEVWETEKHHKESLSQPSVQQAMALGKPLIAAFEAVATTEPVGGHSMTISVKGDAV